MIKKEGEHTCNARVDVDYSKGKPKIKFDYPGKNPEKDAVKQGGEISYPETCGNVSFNELHYNYTKIYGGDFNFTSNYSYSAVYGFNVTCDNKTSQMIYSLQEGNFFTKPELSKDDIIKLVFIFWAVISYAVAIGINRLITKKLVKKKWYQRWLPKANADGILFKRRRKKYAKFTEKELLNNVIVIPRFSNVELDYKTTGEFSKYLESIKIREYRETKINVKTKKKSKEKVDHFKWYAVFYFKQKPKTGHLEVIYL